MRTLTILFSIMALTVSIGCSGGDDGGDDGNTPTADASTNGPDAMPGSGPDAMPGGGNGAANLGVVCNQGTPCPNGEGCVLLAQGATDGICTIACTMPGMPDVCGTADGFPGPGNGFCGLSDGAGGNFCAIGCGGNNNNDTSCPTGLTCQDLDPSPNGVSEGCAPPPSE